MCAKGSTEKNEAVNEPVDKKPNDIEADVRAQLKAAYGTDAALDGFLRLSDLNWEED